MKELDFDELDRAVNSLMAGASTGQKSEPSEKVLEVPTTAPVPTTPPSSMPTPLATPSARPSVQAPVRSSAAPAARRGGRFMDVVHPSQGVKKEVSKPVTREAATIQPTQDMAASPLRQESPKPVETSVVLPDTTAPKNEWPDPLDMANFSGGNEKQEKPALKDEPASDTREPVKQDEDLPLVSPFLPDTKVEKRPLGGNTSSNETPAIVSPVEDIEDQLPATIEDTKPLLPEEFHSDLVAIEADTTAPERHSKPEDTSAEMPRTVNEPEEMRKSPEAPAAEKERPSVPAGPGSIPQQYKEEKSTGDQENGAIYDTNAYHQPLSHPAKQKSGWMWVVWIILILVIGAGGGAALYLLGIIR